ncbi:MAG: putative toxin-antitoxin system toxin component, PIN family [Nanoarchaeota archaeon]
MRITVDTNILISATFWHGAPEKVISAVEDGRIQLLLSEELIKEYVRVLNYDGIRKHMKEQSIVLKQAIKKIIAIATIIQPKTKLDVIKDDPDDNKILECALSGNADCVISGDKHLLR